MCAHATGTKIATHALNRLDDKNPSTRAAALSILSRAVEVSTSAVINNRELCSSVFVAMGKGSSDSNPMCRDHSRRSLSTLRVVMGTRYCLCLPVSTVCPQLTLL